MDAYKQTHNKKTDVELEGDKKEKSKRQAKRDRKEEDRALQRQQEKVLRRGEDGMPSGQILELQEKIKRQAEMMRRKMKEMIIMREPGKKKQLIDEIDEDYRAIEEMENLYDDLAKEEDKGAHHSRDTVVLDEEEEKMEEDEKWVYGKMGKTSVGIPVKASNIGVWERKLASLSLHEIQDISGELLGDIQRLFVEYAFDFPSNEDRLVDAYADYTRAAVRRLVEEVSVQYKARKKAEEKTRYLSEEVGRCRAGKGGGKALRREKGVSTERERPKETSDASVGTDELSPIMGETQLMSSPPLLTNEGQRELEVARSAAAFLRLRVGELNEEVRDLREEVRALREGRSLSGPSPPRKRTRGDASAPDAGTEGG